MIDETELPKTDNTGVCEECFGTGTKLDPVKGAIPCPCRRPDRFKKLLAAARIPPRYAKCSFNTFKSAPGTSQDNALLLAQNLVNDFPVDRGLLFMGPAGVGKTHLAVAIIRGLIEKGFAGVFCEFGSLLKEIQDSYNPISKSSELGATIPTDWVRDTMYQIINKRYNDQKLTIFTTNYSDARGSDKEQVLEDRIGTRLRSRLYEMCKKVVMDGGDYRRVGL
jgi:DNA replication protein DnaC